METTINRRSKIHRAISNWLKLCFLISLVLRIPIEKQLAIRPPKPMPIKKVLHVQHIAMKELTLVTLLRFQYKPEMQLFCKQWDLMKHLHFYLFLGLKSHSGHKKLTSQKACLDVHTTVSKDSRAKNGLLCWGWPKVCSQFSS